MRGCSPLGLFWSGMEVVWRVGDAPEYVNMVVAHELSHKECYEECDPDRTGETDEGKDGDKDFIPNEWETAMGMNRDGATFDENTRPDFLKAYTADRWDQEFYARISTAKTFGYIKLDGQRVEDKHQGIPPEWRVYPLYWSVGSWLWEYPW